MSDQPNEDVEQADDDESSGDIREEEDSWHRFREGIDDGGQEDAPPDIARDDRDLQNDL